MLPLGSTLGSAPTPAATPSTPSNGGPASVRASPPLPTAAARAVPLVITPSGVPLVITPCGVPLVITPSGVRSAAARDLAGEGAAARGAAARPPRW